MINNIVIYFLGCNKVYIWESSQNLIERLEQFKNNSENLGQFKTMLTEHIATMVFNQWGEREGELSCFQNLIFENKPKM